MSEREKHIQRLFTAELQFRLASAVRLATTRNLQPLDFPMVWTNGQHRVRYEEIALRRDQADYAALFLHRSATFLLAVAMKDAIRAVVPDPKTFPDSDVRAASCVSDRTIEAIPSDAVPVKVERLPDGGIELGGGHILYPGEKEKE